MYPPWRRMGDNDVDPAPPPGHRTHAPHHPGHLLLGVLVGSAVVPHGAFQPHELEPTKQHDPFMDIAAAKGRIVPITDVMVSLDVKQGDIERVRQVAQIFRGQITAAQHQVDRPQAFFVGSGVELGIDDIRDG